MSSPQNPTANGVAANAHGEHRKDLAGLVLGAIGVVFGDIGTSPLYTLKQAFLPHYGLTPDHVTVLGVLSLVFWALMIVVTLSTCRSSCGPTTKAKAASWR